MEVLLMPKTYEEINAKIKSGEAVVLTAEEMIDVVDEHGPENRLFRLSILWRDSYFFATHNLIFAVTSE